MKRTQTSRLVVAGFALLASVPRTSRADETAPAPATEEARTRARALAEKGDLAFGAGRCDQAIPLWKDADRAFHAATIELRIAHCQALLGRVVDATATLEAMTHENLAEGAPPAFVAAQAQAATELPSVRERVATLVVEPPRGVPLTALSVDDVPLDPKKLEVRVDPGRRFVRLRAGGASWDGPAQFADGERRVLKTSTVLEAGPEPPHTLRNVGYIVGGAGILSIGVGAVAGIAALTLGRPLEDQCGANRDQCPQNQRERITQVKTASLLSDVFLGSGIILLGAGGYLILRDLAAEKPASRMKLVVSGSGASLTGTF